MFLYQSKLYQTSKEYDPRKRTFNLFIIFPQDQQDLSYIYRDHCGEIDKEEFNAICKEIWSEKYNFITIDKTSEKNRGKFRKQLK